MARTFRQTHFCMDPKCEGRIGFPVIWAPDTEIDPAYPLTDTCPYCDKAMADERIWWDDVVDGILGALPTDVKEQVVDHDVLKNVVYRELVRQGAVVV